MQQKQPYQTSNIIQSATRQPFGGRFFSIFNKLLQEAFKHMNIGLREGIKKIDFFLGKSPKLWVGGGQES